MNSDSQELYCLNCGKVVVSNYKGETMALVHRCSGYHSRKINECKALTTIDAPLMNMSLLPSTAYLTHFKCKQCKTIDEHIENVIQDYLGVYYKEFTPANPKIAEYKQRFIEDLRKRAIGLQTKPDSQMFA